MVEYIHQLKGFLFAQWLYLMHYKLFLKMVNRCAHENIDKPSDLSLEQKLYIMTGYSKVGKTTFVENHPILSKCLVIDSNSIHDILNSFFNVLNDEKRPEGTIYWARQFLAKIIRKKLLSIYCETRRAIVCDSCHLRKKDRLKLIAGARDNGYATEIVWIDCLETVLYSRLERLDQKRVEGGEKAVWVDLYEQVQRERFEAPELDEGPFVQYITSSELKLVEIQGWGPYLG